MLQLFLSTKKIVIFIFYDLLLYTIQREWVYLQIILAMGFNSYGKELY